MQRDEHGFTPMLRGGGTFDPGAIWVWRDRAVIASRDASPWNVEG